MFFRLRSMCVVMEHFSHAYRYVVCGVRMYDIPLVLGVVFPPATCRTPLPSHFPLPPSIKARKKSALACFVLSIRGLVFIASPNNPTGGIITRAQLTKLCRGASKALVVIDEAYAEFSDATHVALLSEFPNLLVRVCVLCYERFVIISFECYLTRIVFTKFFEKGFVCVCFLFFFKLVVVIPLQHH